MSPWAQAADRCRSKSDSRKYPAQLCARAFRVNRQRHSRSDLLVGAPGAGTVMSRAALPMGDLQEEPLPQGAAQAKQANPRNQHETRAPHRT